MEKIPSMVDMKMSPKEKSEMTEPMAVMASAPDYPYGLSISLGEEELDKVGLDDEDLKVGDLLHMSVMMKVTSVSSNESERFGSNCRVELQITHMSGEDADEPKGKAAKPVSADKRRARLYSKG